MNRYQKLKRAFFQSKQIGLAFTVVVLALAAYPAWRVWAAAGDLDTSFSSDGRKEDLPFSNITTLTSRPIRPRTAIQADGKILVLIGEGFTSSTETCNGIGNFEIVRLKQNGDLDTNFGSNGKVTTGFGGCERAADLAIQPDGKIIVAGGAGDLFNGGKLILARYNLNGSLDTSFDGDGKVIGHSNTTALKVALQNDGKILVYGIIPNNGPPTRILLRLNSNGSVDTTFGNGYPAAGYHHLSSTCVPPGLNFFYRHEDYSLRVQNDGKILVSEVAVGSCIQRLNSDSQPDTSFGQSGTVQISQLAATDLKLQNNNKLVVLGYQGIHRYNSDGSPDLGFGMNGMVANPQPSTYNYALAIQEDGRLLAAGTTFFVNRNRAFLSRFLSDGTLDTSFGQGGIRMESFPNLPNLDQDFGSVLLQADGRIVAAGIHNSSGENKLPVMARYKNDNTDTQTTDVAIGPITASPAAVYPGSIVTYTIPIKNNSATKAAHVTLTSSVPSGTSFVGINLYPDWVAYDKPSPGGMGTISASTYQLAANTTTTVQIRVAVSMLAYSGQTISLVASVGNTIPDTTLNNLGVKVLTVQ